MSDIALDRHALLSDCGAAALVTDTGSVDWLCLPAFDSPPVFASCWTWPGDGRPAPGRWRTTRRVGRRSGPGPGRDPWPGLERTGRRIRPVPGLGRAGCVGAAARDGGFPAERRHPTARHDRRDRTRAHQFPGSGLPIPGADGLAGEEGSFLLCTGWLAHALACTDQVQRARTVLDRLARCASPLGLFSEQVSAGTLLGNYPQALSHLGLIIAAQALADAEGRTDPPA